MPKRRREDKVDTSTSTIVTTFSPKNLEVSQCLSAIQRSVAEIMTLATKLGNLFLMQKSNDAYKLIQEQTFWRFCTEMVSTLRGKEVAGGKPREYKQRDGKPPKQIEAETDDQYERRCLLKDGKPPKRIEAESDDDYERRCP